MTADYARRPAPSEQNDYHGQYIAKVPDGDVLEVLERQVGETLALLGGIAAEKAEYRYAPGKWTVKEVVGHLIDTERVFAYRALRFARGDRTPLSGFDQDELTAGAECNARRLEDLLEEFRLVRASNLALFRSFGEEAAGRVGTCDEKPLSARAVAYVLAGHERHHVEVLRERYLG